MLEYRWTDRFLWVQRWASQVGFTWAEVLGLVLICGVLLWRRTRRANWTGGE